MASKSRPVPFIVSYGEETLFLDRDIEKAKTWKGRNIKTLDGSIKGLRGVDVVSVCETRWFDDPPGVVILDEAQAVKDDGSLERYIEAKDPTDDLTVLVAVLRSDTLSEPWVSAGKKGRLYHHPKLKSWESNNEVLKWIPMEAARLDLALAKGVADRIFTYVGADLVRISKELQKMALLVGAGGTVQLEHVNAVIVVTVTSDPSQVLEAVMKGDVTKALTALGRMYKDTGDGTSVIMSSVLAKHLEKMVLTKYLLDKKVAEDAIAGRLDMHPWRFRTFFLPSVRKHPLKTLVGLMDRMCKLDLDVKSGGSGRTGVELALLALMG